MAISDKTNQKNTFKVEAIEFPPPPNFQISKDREAFKVWYEQFSQAIQIKINALSERISSLESQ